MAEAEREEEVSDDLIVAAGSRTRQCSGAVLERVLRHVASAGFDPHALEYVRRNIVGLARPAGGQVQRGDRLPPAEVHDLRHVVFRQEWPVGTTLAGYLASIREVIEDSASRVLVSRYQGAWQHSVVREFGILRGPEGFPLLLVDDRVATGHWVTADQLRDGRLGITARGREDSTWLR